MYGARVATRFRGSAIECGPDNGRFLGVEHGFDPDHAVRRVVTADVTTVSVILRGHLGVVALDDRVLPTDRLELRARAEAGLLEEHGLVRLGRDAGHRADLGIGHVAAPKGLIDLRKIAEPVRDADVLACRAGIPPDAPRQPLRTRPGALLIPATSLVEGAQIGQQPVCGCIEMCRVLGDAVAEGFHCFSIHHERIACEYENDLLRTV